MPHRRPPAPDDVPVERLDKVLFPDCGVTKGDLIRHYREVAELILPQLAGRPLSLQRFPDGIESDGFYQKESGGWAPDWAETVKVEKEGGTVTHVVCSNEATLVWLANQACITLHRWLSRAPELERPDRLVFDLDPPGERFDLVRRAARDLRTLLEDLGLSPWLMTTGGRGLHVVVPLDRSADFDATRAFARAVADRLARQHPDAYTTEVRKAKRRGRLFLDWLRNGWAQTAVAPYAVRARPGAPVATPLDWDELGRRELRGDSWNTRNIVRRLGQVGDRWEGMDRHAASLPPLEDRA